MISTYNIIGKQVACLSTGKQLGTVSNIVIKQTKVDNLCICLDEDDKNEYMTIPTQNMCCLDSDIITVKSFAHTALYESSPTTKILGLSVIDELGKKQYELTDVLFDKDTKHIKHLVGNDGKRYDLSTIANIGRDFIVQKGNIKTRSASKPKKSLAKTNKPKISVDIVKPKEEKLTLKLSPQMLMPTASCNTCTKPSKTIADYAFLLGRVVTNTLIHENKILVTSGQKLTINNLEQIIKSGNLSFALKYSIADFC